MSRQSSEHLAQKGEDKEALLKAEHGFYAVDYAKINEEMYRYNSK